MPPPLSHREQTLASMQQPQQQGQGGGGMDLGAIMGMLTHLYGLQQQQAMAPGALQQQQLQNQLSQWHLQHDPEQFRQQQLLDQAKMNTEQSQMDLLKKKTSEVDPPASLINSPQSYQDYWYRQNDKGYATDLAQKAQKKNDDDYFLASQNATRVKDTPQTHDLNTLKFGPSNADWLAQMYQAPPQSLESPGHQLHDQLARTWNNNLSDNAIHQHFTGVGNFLDDLFGNPVAKQQAQSTQNIHDEISRYLQQQNLNGAPSPGVRVPIPQKPFTPNRRPVSTNTTLEG